jgi:NAD(P)-dependent dehydrogenase (short-subunit alcohol dehydrogenase family)
MASIFDLTGRAALVTGGSKGLGLAMARGLAQAGADIAICSRNEQELTKARNGIAAATGRRVEAIPADMVNRKDVQHLAEEATRRLGKIDILVNNAGTNVPQATDAITDETWDNLIELNLTSVMALTRALVPGMKERKWGRVIHISSMFGLISKEKRDAYSATKAGLIGMARASALELGPFNVTVNCLAPGPFLTELPASLLSQAERDEWSRVTALNRWGDPNELVGPLLLLASDAGSYITGQAILVDGGFTVR